MRKIRKYQIEITKGLWQKYRYRVELPFEVYVSLFLRLTITEAIEYINEHLVIKDNKNEKHKTR